MTWKALVRQQSSRSGSRGYVAETQKFEVVEASFVDCFEKVGKYLLTFAIFIKEELLIKVLHWSVPKQLAEDFRDGGLNEGYS